MAGSMNVLGHGFAVVGVGIRVGLVFMAFVNGVALGIESSAILGLVLFSPRLPDDRP